MAPPRQLKLGRGGEDGGDVDVAVDASRLQVFYLLDGRLVHCDTRTSLVRTTMTKVVYMRTSNGFAPFELVWRGVL